MVSVRSRRSTARASTTRRHRAPPPIICPSGHGSTALMAETRDKELRLALVCYGGISLAVYMHGITKEIWRLHAPRQVRRATRRRGGQRRLSRAARRDPRDRRHQPARAGRYPLGRQRRRDQRSLSRPGDAPPASRSIRSPTCGSSMPMSRRCSSRASALRTASPRSGRRRSPGWSPTAARRSTRRSRPARATRSASSSSVSSARAGSSRRSAASGLLNTLLNAFAAHGEGRPIGALLPPGQPLDLFITVTDFRGHPEALRLNSPPQVIETEHRLVFSRFTDHG